MARRGVVHEHRQSRPRQVTRVVRDLDDYPSFVKKIKWKNQHHDTARRGHCELCIPRQFAMEAGIDKHSPLKFVTRSLIEGGTQRGHEPYIRMSFRDPDHNNGNFVIRHGWLTFMSFHDIKKNWSLKFTLMKPDQFYVRRLKSTNADLIQAVRL